MENRQNKPPEGGTASGHGGQKFHTDSEQAKLHKSKLRMESREERLNKARERLAKQKPPKKPGPIKRIARIAGHETHAFLHGKVYQEERDNVGVEGGHFVERSGEAALHYGRHKVRRAIREHPAKAAARAESRYIKATADYHSRKFAQEQPEAQSAAARLWHRHKLKREYQRKARETAKQTAKAAEQTVSATERFVREAAAFVKRHPVGTLLALGCLLVVLTLQSCMSSMVSVGNSTLAAIAASTYKAEDADMLGAEAAYCALEDELQRYLDTYTRTHDYDEYHFDLDTIEHDPYVLISMISALHEGAWTLDEVQGKLQDLFDRQYILTEDVVVEVRYRTVTRTDSEGNDYEVDVPYNYGLNPEKLGAVSSYLCDPATAHAEFMLVKNQYQGETDRRAGHGALCYQIRQAFPHGEVTAEEANRIGYETAMRWTKGKYQFFVCTHIDKEHIHNHIYYNSTAYDRSRKFRNFIGSSFALRRLSDRVCLEHDLSVIANPKLHSKGRYLHYGQWLGENQKLSQKEQIRFAIDAALTERPVDFADFLRRMETAGIQVKRGRGGVISFLVPGQQRAARFRASTLGDGYGPEDVQAVIDGKAPTRTATARKAPAPRRVNLLIDIQERMRQGKGPAYERWAKVYNLKQMAAALQYLKEHQLFEYDDLAAKTDAATERFHTLAGDIQQTEAELSRVSDLMAAVVQYAKTRPAFDGYKAAKYNRKYLAEHEAELADYRAAKATMAELLGGEKLPKMDVLKEKRRQLAARKKALYLEYRKAQQDMRELVAVKGSVDHLRGLTDNQRNKEQAR